MKEFQVKVGLAEMLKGGVIMDVMNVEQAKIAEDAGAAAVMALERIPADIRQVGGVARMSDPKMIREIQAAVSIPVMAKCRIGHIVEAEILQHLGIDFIDESEVLTPADESNHVYKMDFKVPFVCGATNLGEALRRIGEGAAMIRSKGEAGTGDVVQAVRHMRQLKQQMGRIQKMDQHELMRESRDLGAPFELVQYVHKHGKLPVPVFAAGGVATPADAALMMKLGAESVFIGSGIFKSSENLSDSDRLLEQSKRAKACVEAVTHFENIEIVAKVSEGLGQPMTGIAMDELEETEKLETRGW
ncbi:MAG: pyridoxal 5'-phosphate synthase lyase subunit PdxS [Calditrichaeota bacterium]|nr:pyridoxal 5'-phosphate synthase lyase subunit PdxS [Calditrichota bacterium]